MVEDDEMGLKLEKSIAYTRAVQKIIKIVFENRKSYQIIDINSISELKRNIQTSTEASYGKMSMMRAEVLKTWTYYSIFLSNY